MPGHGFQEVVAFEGVEQYVRLGGDRRGTWYLPEQGYLTEEISLFQLGNQAAVLEASFQPARFQTRA
jgi:hypothetical protein